MRHRGVIEQDAAADPIGEVGDHEHGMFSPTVAAHRNLPSPHVRGRHGKADSKVILSADQRFTLSFCSHASAEGMMSQREVSLVRCLSVLAAAAI